MVKVKLGKRIAALRREAGLTQEQLAERVGYSVEFISVIERGINAPSVEGCERIAKAFGIRLSRLFDF